MMKLVALVAAAIAVAACHRPSCVTRCTHLRTLGCAEGRDLEACAAACTASDGTAMGKTIDWDCVEGAASVDAVQKCGLRLCIPR